MRIQFRNRVHPKSRRLQGGAIRPAKRVSNIEKLAKDFGQIYMSQKVKPKKKFVLKLKIPAIMDHFRLF